MTYYIPECLIVIGLILMARYIIAKLVGVADEVTK
jgi:hypothetical protein